MKFFTRVAVLFYVTLLLFLSCFTILYVLHWLNFEEVMELFYMSYYDDQLRFLIGVITGGFLFFNFLFYRLFSIKIQKEKTIAFDNTSGRVTVSLFAIEDLIKSMVGNLSEIRDVKPIIVASKKGIQVSIRLILKDECNIPEMTQKVQELVKKKMHEIIGLDEPINVTIHVSKIIFEQNRDKHKKDKEENLEKELYPFQGYRA